MTRAERRQLKRFNAERDAALIEGTVEAMAKFARKWRVSFPDSHEVAEIMLHKCRCNVLSMPPDLVNESVGWLASHGYDTKIGHDA